MDYTVIIPTHNRLAPLRRALISALHQTCPPRKIIIVEDAPVVSAEVGLLASLASDIIIPRSNAGTGACAARNTGIHACQTDTVAFLDDDDEWAPDKMEIQLRFLQQSPQYIAATCTRILKSHKGIYREFWDQQFCDKYRYYDLFWGPTSSIVYRKNAAPGVFFDTSLPSCQDWDFLLQLSSLGNICPVPGAAALLNIEPLAGRRITGQPDRLLKGLEIIHRKYQHEMDKGARHWMEGRIAFIRCPSLPLSRRFPHLFRGLWLCLRSEMPAFRKTRTTLRYLAEAAWGTAVVERIKKVIKSK